MHGRSQTENGQTAVEFGIIAVALMILTVGLVDVGRAFYMYNEVSGLARFGARWGSVVGGTCALPNAGSHSDFCNSFAGSVTGSHLFWSTLGNKPVPIASGGNGYNTPCPAFSGAGSNPGAYYSVQTYNGTSTIVGALAQRWDSKPGSSGLSFGSTSPGLDRSKVSVCIATSWTPAGTNFDPSIGDFVTVSVRYPFKPASGLFGRLLSFDLLATSTYRVEY